MPPEEVTRRASRVRLILMDVDGVLTDGRIWYAPDGDTLIEMKAFDVVDGAGIVLARMGGIATGFVSGRSSRIVAERARELKVDEVHLGVRDKAAVLEQIFGKRSLTAADVAFVGDDVVDLPAMRRVGFPVAVSNASNEVKAHASYITVARGGRGAVREVVELILKAQGAWDRLVADFLR
jgi:3-deoxy-D-manno-octulosonate 8-phosphate phosphatase (KDO 8-P phosphatase)